MWACFGAAWAMRSVKSAPRIHLHDARMHRRADWEPAVPNSGRTGGAPVVALEAPGGLVGTNYTTHENLHFKNDETPELGLAWMAPGASGQIRTAVRFCSGMPLQENPNMMPLGTEHSSASALNRNNRTTSDLQ